MKSFEGYRLILPKDLEWKRAQPMQIPNADFLERTGSQNLGARLWRFPPMSANTWHKHVVAEEFYFVIEGTGRIRVGDETLTIPRHGGILVGPDQMRQVFNDTTEDVTWLIVSAPDAEFPDGQPIDMKCFWPEDPTQLPKELDGHAWPPE